jgi:hypothetical protein
MKQPAILEAVQRGRGVYEWVPLELGRIRVFVFADALKIDMVRVPVTAATEQQIADMLGGMLLTPKLVDLIYQRAKWRPGPHLLPPTADWPTIQNRSRVIDAEFPELQPTDLIAPVGKDWVLSSKISTTRAANYGLHAKGARYASATLPGTLVWQSVGHAHNQHHTDWSQLCRLVRRRCLLDGREADLRDILSDTALAPLVHHEGHTRVFRQPGTPELIPWESSDSDGNQIEVVEQHDTDRAPPRIEETGRVIVLPEITIYGDPRIPKPPPPPPPSRTASGKIAALAGDEPGVPYIPAKHYRAGRLKPPLWLVVHTAEVGEVPTAATALQRYAATMADGRVASWHYAVSNSEITQSVREKDTAYHGKQANARGIGIELCQRANQTIAQWDDEYSRSVLTTAAELCARIAQRWSIPIRKLTPTQILAEESGFAGHVDFTRAHKVRGGHVDPGPNFPWQHFLGLVQAAHEARFR